MNIIITSLTHKEIIVAEIYNEEDGWAMVTQETDKLMLHIYPKPDGTTRTLNLEDVTNILQEVKRKLLGI